jgi:hypothetical protein
VSDLMLVKTYEVAHDLGDWNECELIADDVKLLLDKLKKLEQENKMMRDYLIHIYEMPDVFDASQSAKQCLSKLTKDER